MNTLFEKTKEYLSGLTLNELLEEISVVDEWYEQPKGFESWCGVETDLGIIAIFATKEDALSFRLNYINKILNG